MSSLQLSHSHLVLRHSSYCYRVRSHVVDHWLHAEDPPIRSHVSGPVPTLQSIWWFSLASTSLFGRTCLQELPVLGLRFSFVANGSIPLYHVFLPFFSRHPCPYGPTTLTPVLVLQLTSIISLDLCSCFFSAYLPIGVNDTGLNRGFTARPDCAVHRPSPLVPRFSLALLTYLSQGSHALTPVWLRSLYRSFSVDPLSCYLFGDIAFGGMPSLRT